MWYLSGAIGLLILLAPLCAAALQSELTIVDPERRHRALDDIVAKLAAKRVVFIGETHDRYDQHLSQLEIVRRLQADAPQRWTLGVEYFQRPFQSHIDAYAAGAISEREFLAKTEYFERWGYDYRLYRPIFQYAKEHGMPMLALNTERELTEKVSRAGLAGLSSSERASLPPEIDKSDGAYRERLHSIFKEHPEVSADGFDRFQEVQLVWDETMAQQISEYLAGHPDKSLIVLAGAGHIEFGSGIPNRVRRRIPGVDTAILLPADQTDADLRGADFLLVSPNRSLPPTGKMGVAMDVSDGVRAKEIIRGSSAAQAGMKTRDRIVSIDGAPVKTLLDFRLALLDKEPGDRVSVRIQRNGTSGIPEELSIQLTLQ